MPTFFQVIAARIRAFLHPGALDSDFREELESHLAMAEEDNVRQGMTREQARRAARLQLGGLTQLREAGREARGLPWLEAYWLDVKLGLRMLYKSWGLTVVGGLAMTLVIGVGVVVFAIADIQFQSRLPLDEGDRVVAIQTWDEKAHGREKTSLEDLERWRQALQSIEDVGAFQTIERSLAIANGAAEPVRIAEMTASGFELARVAPFLGRPLLEQDELAGADPVVVIGYDVWQSRFSADAGVVGQTVRLDDTVHTVVGVMPETYRFPLNNRFWTPLPAARSGVLMDDDGFGVVFGRLAPGVELAGAQAELRSLGLLAPPEPNAERTPRVVRYAFAFTGDFKPGEVRWVIRLILLVATLLLVPPCANVAILAYARTVSRQGEFAARFALGASRRRIVGQLFVEMLVLTAAAALLALVFARLALSWAEATVRQQVVDGLPFWMDFSLSFSTVLFAAGLAIAAALMAAFVPAFKATGRQMQSGLRTVGGRAGMQLGGTWTVLVVAQVALTLAVLPCAVEIGWGTVRPGVLGPGFAAEDYLTARLAVDWESVGEHDKPEIKAVVEADSRSFADRFGALQTELVSRLAEEPSALGVALAAAVPGDEPWVEVEVDGAALPEDSIVSSVNLVRVNHVDDVFFDLFDFRFLTGRGFVVGDLDASRAAVIVNQTFARQLLGDANPLGRRIRYTRDDRSGGAERNALVESEPGRWLEVVGVVADRPANASRGTMYHPMGSGKVHPVSLAVRAGKAQAGQIEASQIAAGQAESLREIAAALDPNLELEEIHTLDEIYREHQVGNNIGASSLAAVTLSVLLLSAAGMYALMSFTVNQRRREIGIRAALGAQPTDLLAGIFKKALSQVATGAGIGVLVALLLDYYLPAEALGGWEVPGVIPGAALFMLMIGLLAAVGPARRALRVQPIDELREG